MSLEVYILEGLKALEKELKALEKRLARLEGNIAPIEENYVCEDYFRAAIEKACPAAQKEKWWDEVLESL